MEPDAYLRVPAGWRSASRLASDEMKKECQPHCFSTLNHNLGYCYNDARVIKWVLRQAARAFQGVTGSFD